MRRQLPALRAANLDNRSIGGDIDDRADGPIKAIAQRLFDGLLLAIWTDDQPFVGSQPNSPVVPVGKDSVRHDRQSETERRSEPLHQVVVSWVGPEVDLRDERKLADGKLAPGRRCEGGEPVPVIGECAAPNRLSYHGGHSPCRRRPARSRW